MKVKTNTADVFAVTHPASYIYTSLHLSPRRMQNNGENTSNQETFRHFTES